MHYECTRKDGAVGVDGQTADEYALNLECNLADLLDRLKSGRYRVDSIPRAELRAILARRVADGVVRRLIDKWLKAGVLELGQVHYPEAGTPQGGTISPILSNVFLHRVIDAWFAREVQPRLRGPSTLVRFCDDFVMLFAHKPM
jgi:Reverse transcriptase (RNA-dependent DNA polymerase)